MTTKFMNNLMTYVKVSTISFFLFSTSVTAQIYSVFHLNDDVVISASRVEQNTFNTSGPSLQ